VEKSYKRNENIDEKIQSVKLPYLSWKVLFLVDEALESKQIAEMLETDMGEIDTALQRLIDSDLVSLSTMAEPFEALPEKDTVIYEPQKEEVAEVPEPDVTENILPADLVEASPQPEANLMPELDMAEEPPELPISLENNETPEIMEPESNELVLELQEETLQTPAESEMEGLDVDFAAETAEPMPETFEPVQASTEIPQPPKGPSRKTILVVDDSIVIRKMVEIALEDENFNIDTAVSGKEGLSKIDRINPDLVILDLMLPDINGIDILKTVKASRGIPVIMLSGKDSPQMVEKAKVSGADAFLPKPFKDDELIEKIKSLLNV